MTGGSRFTLREATPSELEHVRRGHASEWGGPLSVEQYLGREIHIASQTLTQNGGIRFWVLTPSSEPSQLLCSCESIAKPAVVRSATKDGKEEVREVTSHVIGSVYTPPHNRGNGYASIMMSMLGSRLECECEFDALYSDIGKTFYARKGWKPYSSSHISLPPGTDIFESSGVKLLSDFDLPPLCQKDVDSIISSYHRTPLSPNTDACVAYLPTYAVIRWHHAREEYVGKQLTDKVPTVKGAMAPSGKRWIVWNRFFNQKELTILRIVDMDEKVNRDNRNEVDVGAEEMLLLLKVAREEARKWGMDEVVIWSPGERVVSAAERILGRKVKAVDRDMDSVASLRWNGKGGRDANIEWELNEKFGWC